jgi:hypothetical protein
MTAIAPQPAVPPHKLRWYQYSLRSLLLFVTACAVVCSWLAVTIQSQRRQAEAARAIEKLGGYALSKPTWLGRLLRDDSLLTVTNVGLSDTKATDDELVRIEALGELKALWLTNTRITDAGLVHLQGLGRLETLGLDGATKITDVGLLHLQELTRLRCLVLIDTQVTDAGLVHLEGLSQLKELDLCGTNVSDEGVKKLQQALPNCEIHTSLPP